MIQHHFIGVSTKPENDRMKSHQKTSSYFGIGSVVVTRYWSCIGLPIALQIGVDGFKQLLAGAYAIDQHFQKASFEQNIQY